MLRRNFLKTAGVVAVAPALKEIPGISSTTAKKEIYEWRVYTLHKGADKLDQFYEKH